MPQPNERNPDNPQTTGDMQNEGVVMEIPVFRSGFTIDGREFPRSVVKAIVKNTKQHLLEKGFTVPLKFGHEDRNQFLKGKVLDLRLARRKRKGLKGVLSNDLFIMAKVHFFGEAWELFKMGRLPNFSIELAPKGFDADGNQFGPHVSGLAMLGVEAPAIPDLMPMVFATGTPGIFFSRNSKPVRYRMETQNEGTPSTNEFEATSGEFAAEEVIPLIQGAMEKLQEVLAMVEMAPEEEAEAEMAKEEGDPEEEKEMSTPAKTPETQFNKLRNEKQSLEKQVLELQVENKFNSLHASGKVASDERKDFESLTNKAGLDFALDFYSKRKHVPKTPPQGKPVKSSGEKAKEEESMKYWKQHYARNKKLSEQEVERFAKQAVKIASEQGDVTYGIK